MNRVAVLHPPRFAPLARRVKRSLGSALKQMRLERSEVSVSLVTDTAIRKLNRRYRHRNRPTDVLSFSQDHRGGGPWRALGDIVISTQTARRQAKRFSRSLEQECDLLAVHGLLHLLGYDHAAPKEAKTMFALQNRILNGLGRRA